MHNLYYLYFFTFAFSSYFDSMLSTSLCSAEARIPRWERKLGLKVKAAQGLIHYKPRAVRRTHTYLLDRPLIFPPYFFGSGSWEEAKEGSTQEILSQYFWSQFLSLYGIPSDSDKYLNVLRGLGKGFIEVLKGGTNCSGLDSCTSLINQEILPQPWRSTRGIFFFSWGSLL